MLATNFLPPLPPLCIILILLNLIGIIMHELVFFLKLNGFNGDSLLIQDTIDENLNSKSELLKKGLSSNSKIKIIITRFNRDIFKIFISILNNYDMSEDVAISQIELNLKSMHKKGILNTGIHEWELNISTHLNNLINN